MAIRHCNLCGKEYETHVCDSRGYYTTLRTSYCSKHCAAMAKKAAYTQREKHKKLQQAAAKSYSTDVESSPYINQPYGPVASAQCFFCPYCGNGCRYEKYPICRQSHPRHAEYDRRLREVEP